MKVVLWDFDGTLAQREGMWTGSLLEVLDNRCPGHAITREVLRPHLLSGFPWHTPDIAHEPCPADQWWARVEPVFERAYAGAGIGPDRAPHRGPPHSKSGWLLPPHRNCRIRIADRFGGRKLNESATPIVAVRRSATGLPNAGS